MEPFYFGPEQHRLFGVHHAPAKPRETSSGALLCYPFLQEYFRSHRAFLRLAVQLAARGWHVMRFDYSGCGDSYGDGPRDSEAWAQDIGLAARELRGRAGTTRLALIGLRLGASLAAKAAPIVQPLSELVLWDPIVDGPQHVKELLGFRHAATMLAGARRRIQRLGVSDRGVGLELSPELMQTIGQMSFDEQLNARAQRILVLDTQRNRSTADFARRLGKVRSGVALKRLSELPVWVENKRNDRRNITVPTASLRAIVDWISPSNE